MDKFCPGKTAGLHTALCRFYASLDETRKQEIISISMDMSPAYQKATFDHIEKTHRKVAFDHSHVVRMLTQALDATRKPDMKRADSVMRRRSIEADSLGYSTARAAKGCKFSALGSCRTH